MFCFSRNYIYSSPLSIRWASCPPPRHLPTWGKGTETSHCSPDFCSLSVPVTADTWASGLPPLPPGQAALPQVLIPHCLFSTCSFTLVTRPGFNLLDLLGAGVLGQLHTGFENRTPPQSRKKVEWQHWVRQRLSRHLGSQGEPDILTFGQLTCPIPTLKLTRTNKSPQNVSFAQNQHFLLWELLCQWLLCFSTISNSELNLMRFCSSITSTAHQAQRESCTTDSSDATQNISAQQGFRSSSGNKWLYCLSFLLWQIPSQSATSLC